MGWCWCDASWGANMAETHRDLRGNIVGGSLGHLEQNYWCEGQITWQYWLRKRDAIGLKYDMRNSAYAFTHILFSRGMFLNSKIVIIIIIMFIIICRRRCRRHHASRDVSAPIVRDLGLCPVAGLVTLSQLPGIVIPGRWDKDCSL